MGILIKADQTILVNVLINEKLKQEILNCVIAIKVQR